MLISIWGKFCRFQLLTEPVVEHQFDVIDDTAEETTFFHFVHHYQRTLSMVLPSSWKLMLPTTWFLASGASISGEFST
jgi:hypothetical protein